MAQVHQFLTEVPRFLGFLKIRCQAAAAAGLHASKPGVWLGARHPLRRFVPMDILPI
jgi:hypothetical protein